MRIRSVEQLIFRKYPLVCPYCRKAPHLDLECKQVRGTEATLNHGEVTQKFKDNWGNRPRGLNEWQQMFATIYPRNVQEGARSVVALMEELGELSEAVRVFDVHPQYFLGEAADTFSYLMGIATEHEMREVRDGREFSFEQEYLKRYPGLCTQCGSQVCVCPAVPSATIGRMAKELNISTDEQPFIADLNEFDEEGIRAGHIALEEVGGYHGIVGRLPFDRGDANHALVHLCLKIADHVEGSNPSLAATLRSEAVRLGASPSPAGSPSVHLDLSTLIDELRAEWRNLSEEDQEQIKSAGGLIEGLGEALETIRVLFIAPNPTGGGAPLNLAEEQRAIKAAIKSGQNASKIIVEDLPAARPNDFRTILLREQFDVIHFSGHADATTLVFEGEGGVAEEVELNAFAQTVSEYPIKCVVLNACESVQNMTQPISPLTIGMDKTVPDAAAIEFSRGFYDAVASGRDFRRAFTEGRNAVRLAGHDDSLIRIIPRS